MALTWLTPNQLDKALLNDVDAGKPFSLLRFGDGEYEVCKFIAGASHNDASFIDKFNRWFGSTHVGTLKHTELVGLTTMILEAFKRCAYLGIPSFREAYGYPKWAGIDKFVNKHMPKGITFHFYDIFTLWRNQRTFQEILRVRNNIDLITCRPNLEEKLKARFALKRVGMELIQPEYFMWKGKDAGLQKFVTAWKGEPHYPQRFKEICGSLKSQAPLNGRVFFVGAGGLGKIYCEIIRKHGGIALDVGAMLDGWDGLTTRPYLQKIEEYRI